MSEVPSAATFEKFPRPTGRAMPIALLILCLLGVAVSALSTRDHVRFRASGGTREGACAALIDSGCKSAHSSKWAEILGVPISHFGTGFYLAVAGLAVLALVLRKRRAGGRAAGIVPIVTVMGLGAVTYSLFLATVRSAPGKRAPSVSPCTP